jgi:hypothetical protein
MNEIKDQTAKRCPHSSLIAIEIQAFLLAIDVDISEFSHTSYTGENM